MRPDQATNDQHTATVAIALAIKARVALGKSGGWGNPVCEPASK
jgi:hypothetical protein